MRHNTIKNYYIKDQKHVCRFCGTPIAKLSSGKLVPLANHKMAQFALDDGSFHMFNGCADCLNRIDFKRYPGLMTQIYNEDLEYHKKQPTPNEPQYKEGKRALRGYSHVIDPLKSDLTAEVKKAKNLLKGLRDAR